MTDHDAIRRTVFIKTYNSDHNGDWIPKELPDAVKWLQGKLDQIPTEHQVDAYFEINVDRHTSYPTIEIGYCRPETDSEFNGRRSMDKVKKSLEEEKEIRLLHVLKKKYPDEV